MTLKEWSEQTGISPTTETGVVSVFIDNGPEHWQLWRLDDYVVSSASASVVRLVPRKQRFVKHDL